MGVNRFMRTVALLAACSICGCGLLGDAQQLRSKEGHVLKLSSVDNRKTLNVKLGQEIVIELPVFKGTGYSWKVATTERLSFLTREEPAEESSGLSASPPLAGPGSCPPQATTPKSDSRPGGVEIQSFRLTFTRPGDTDVNLECRRPWDAKSAPANSFHVKVKIK